MAHTVQLGVPRARAAEGQTPGPGKTDLVSFTGALVGLQSAPLFLPLSPRHRPGQALMAATSLSLRDGSRV